MRQYGLYIIIALFAAALIGYLLWLDKRRQQRLRLRVKKLYASPMYAAMWQKIKECRSRTIEHLRLDQNGFTVSFMQPAGEIARYASIKSISFILRREGFITLSPEQEEALIILMEDALPKLSDGRKYAFRRSREQLQNGAINTVFDYVIKNEYKNMLARAPYYDETLSKEAMVRNGWI